MKSLLLLFALFFAPLARADIDGAPLGDVGFDINVLTGASNKFNTSCDKDPCVIVEKNGVWYLIIMTAQTDLMEVYLVVGDENPTFLLLWKRPDGIKLKAELEIKTR